jgi:hypothetical protein
MTDFSFVQHGAYLPRADRHRLVGQVNIDDMPGSCLICVFENTYYTLVAAQISNPTTGLFEFKGLLEFPNRSLLVVANDLTGLRNSISFNYVSQTN